MIKFLMKIFMVILLLAPLFIASYACFKGSFSYSDRLIKSVLFLIGLIIFTESSIELEKILNVNWFIDGFIYILTLILVIVVSIKEGNKTKKQKTFKRMNPKSLSKVSGIKR